MRLSESCARSIADWTICGASNAIAYCLLPRAAQAGKTVLALNRSGRPEWSRGYRQTQWQIADLFASPPVQVESPIWISTGPLDGFANYLIRCRPRGVRQIIALSSSSIYFKASSSDPHERQLIERLRAAEQALTHWCSENGIAWTLLRPTLIYGTPLDRSLTLLRRAGGRFGFICLPTNANGLRQPIHADDVAQAIFNAVANPKAYGQTIDLAGGEILTYREFTRRTLAPDKTKIFSIPSAIFSVGLNIAHRLGKLSALSGASAERMAEDLVLDNGKAEAVLGHRPRPFVVD